MASMEEFVASGEIDSIAARAVAELRGLRAPDLVRDLAVRVVTEVMARMTGLLPAESLHLYWLHRPIVRFLAGDASATAAASANLEDALDLYARREPPGTEPGAPLVRTLHDAVRDNSLSGPEFRRNRILLFMGGTETVVCALSNTLWTIATDSRSICRLRESNPA